jgi:putative SOS response-associated peptidase YedK
MPVILSPEDVEVWLDPKNDDQILRVVENCLICKEKAIWKDIGITKLGPHVSNQS